MARITIDIDPTLFNVLFDVVAVLNTMIFAAALDRVVPFIIERIIQSGISVPLEFLGGASVLAGLDKSNILNMCKMKGVVIVWIPLVISSFFFWSHTVADIDLDFVEYIKPAGKQVLYLDLSLRDDFEPTQRLLGEPQRTDTIYIASSFEEEQRGFKVESTVDAYIISIENKLGTVCESSTDNEDEIIGSGRLELCQLAVSPENKMSKRSKSGVTRLTSTYVFPGEQGDGYTQIPVAMVVNGTKIEGFEDFWAPSDWRKRVNGTMTKFGREITTLDEVVFGNHSLMVEDARISLAGLGQLWSLQQDILFFEYIVSAQVTEPNATGDLCETGDSTGCLVFVYMECALFGEEFPDGDDLLPATYAPLCYTFGADVVTGDFGKLPPGYMTVVSGAVGKNRRRSPEPGTFLRISCGSIIGALFSGATIQKDWVDEEIIRPNVGWMFFVFSLLPWLVVAILSVFRCKELKVPIPTSPLELIVFGRGEQAVPMRKAWDAAYPEVPSNLRYGFHYQSQNSEVRLGCGTNPITFQDFLSRSRAIATNNPTPAPTAVPGVNGSRPPITKHDKDSPNTAPEETTNKDSSKTEPKQTTDKDC